MQFVTEYPTETNPYHQLTGRFLTNSGQNSHREVMRDSQRSVAKLYTTMSSGQAITTWGGFSLVWFSLGFDVQNHKRWSTLIQRIPFRSSSQENLIPFRFCFPTTLINVDGPEQRPVEHEAKPNQRKPALGYPAVLVELVYWVGCWKRVWKGPNVLIMWWEKE